MTGSLVNIKWKHQLRDNENFIAAKPFAETRPWSSSNWNDTTTNSSSDDFYESYEALSEKSIQKDDIVFTDLTVYPDFDLSIELYLYPNHHWANVFGFGVAGMVSYIGGVGFTDGNRVPAVWLGENDTTLSVSFSINGNGNHVWRSEQPMAIEKWFKLEIKQEWKSDISYRRHNMLPNHADGFYYKVGPPLETLSLKAKVE